MRGLIVVLAVVLSYSIPAIGQEEGKQEEKPFDKATRDSLFVATIAKIRSVEVLPDGRRILRDSASNVLFPDEPISTQPMPNGYQGDSRVFMLNPYQADSSVSMPNAYQGDSCVPMPNPYEGDRCVPMPNAYQGPMVLEPPHLRRDSIKTNPMRQLKTPN